MNGCVIKKEWVEKANKLLPTAEARCEFYEALFADAFGQERKPIQDAAAAIMYEMCKDTIQDDLRKYEERCERNRANAQSTRSHSQPLAPTRSHSQQVAPNINIKDKSIKDTNVSINTSPLTPQGAAEKEKFDCIGIFFNRDADDPVRECEEFWNYYDALGWHNSRGAEIVSKTSAAKGWRMKGDAATDLQYRECYYKAMKDATTDPRIWTDYIKIELSVDTAILYIKTNKMRDLLEKQCMPNLQALCKEIGAQQLEYRIKK